MPNSGAELPSWTAAFEECWQARGSVAIRKGGSARSGKPTQRSSPAAYWKRARLDNLAHTLAGAALGEAGLKKKTGLGMATVRTVVASPGPVNPFRRDVVFGIDDAYGFGVLRWTPSPTLQLDAGLIEKNMDDPAITDARQVKEIADFLYWSRLPFATVERRSDGTIVTIADARYAKAVTAGRFMRRLRLPPEVAPDQSQRAPDGPQAAEQHGAERR